MTWERGFGAMTEYTAVFCDEIRQEINSKHIDWRLRNRPCPDSAASDGANFPLDPHCAAAAWEAKNEARVDCSDGDKAGMEGELPSKHSKRRSNNSGGRICCQFATASGKIELGRLRVTEARPMPFLQAAKRTRTPQAAPARTARGPSPRPSPQSRSELAILAFPGQSL